ncbi:MAG: extracellular solute-binding protein, partial [Betaproteobacteria bacterium]|nr:extracellular solute-binding protein [Betaproteobacteria bacterium]
MNKRLLMVMVTCMAVVACEKKQEAQAPVPAVAANTEEKVLNVYNWPDYVAQDMIANFEKETGIKVNYQTFENNEALQAKLVAGNSGYDIVVPGSVFVKAQIEAGLLKKLDKALIPNYKNLDADLMQ